MRISRTDVFATVAVGVGVIVYSTWLAGAAVPGLGSVRAVGLVVLVLGWLASAVAVVPNFDELIHASRPYLVVTGILGVVALMSGVIVLVDSSETMLASLVSATVAMWVLATIRHTLAARRGEPAPAGGEPVGAVDEGQLRASR